MVELDPSVEQQLADLSEDDWRSLSARVRQPTSAQRLREAASQVISDDRLEAFLAVADPKSFTNDVGDIDEVKVHSQLRTLFDLPPAPSGPRWQNFGQGAAGPPAPGPGERGRAEAQKRFGGPRQLTTGTGSGGAAEAAKRFGKADN